MKRQKQSRAHMRGWGWVTVAVAILYYVTGKLSLYYTIESSIVTISVFFPEGFALAGVLLFGPRVAVGIFVGQLALALGQDFALLPAAGIAAGNAAEGLIGYYLLQRLRFDTRLLRLQDIYLLVGVILFVLQPFSAFWGSLILYLFAIVPGSEIVRVFFAWWFGNTMGQLLLTPLLLYLYHNRHRIIWLKLWGVSVLFGLVCYSFIDLIPVENSWVLFSITIVPLVVLLSSRLGMVYALFSIVVITLIVIYTANHHIGPFSLYDEETNLINLNFYILAHILTVLIIGVLFIEKQRALAQLENLNRHLKARVTREVEKNREKDRVMFFQSRLAQMGEMLSLITHQWQQPLNNLSLIHQSLYLSYLNGQLNESKMESLYRDLQQQIKQMIDTGETFKDFFKTDKKKHLFCINDTIDYVVDVLMPACLDAQIAIHIHAPQKVYFSGYANEFSQAILNILTNAKDVLAAQNTHTGIINISLHAEAEKIMLEICDNGGGVDETMLSQIFDPYFSTKVHKGGMGLGLYLSRLIIEEYMGGTISARNKDAGACFTITLYTQREILEK